MQVFVLGATGWTGSAITDALLVAHHQVVGLTSTAQAASMLEAKGATAVQGDMSDANVLLMCCSQWHNKPMRWLWRHPPRLMLL